MKNAIKVLCFVLVVIIASAVFGYVYFKWDKGEFEIVDGSEFGTAIITDYIGTETDVVIPKRLRGKKVISIDDNAFSETDITSVKISNSVVSIGINAFRECPKLVSVDMGDSVKNIGNNAFSYCAELSEVVFSPAVEKIGEFVFGSDDKLETLNLNGNKNFIFTDGVLYSADMTTIYATLSSADLSNYTCPETVNNLIGFAFFAQDEIKSIKLNDGIKTIPIGTFVNCKSLTELTIPDSVVSIGTIILSGSGVKTIKIPASVQKIDDSAFLNVEDQITIVTTKGSYAAKYAERNEIAYKIVEAL